MSHELERTCTFNELNDIVLAYCGHEYQPGLVLQPTAADHDGVTASLKFRTLGDWWLTLPFGIDADALTNFLHALKLLDRELAGVAILAAGDDDRLTYSIQNRGRGILKVEGEWFALVTPPTPEESDVLPGIRCTFTGYECEQSYLPGIISQLSELVR